MLRLGDAQTRELLRQPESGMGYQVVEATLTNNTIALGVTYNAELLLFNQEPRTMLAAPYRILLQSARSAVGEIKALRVVPRTGTSTFSLAREASVVKKAGPAKDAAKESTKTGEIFKRFSAYENDHRVMPDRSLRPGSYATTDEDAEALKAGTDAVARYALPNPSPASYRFTISPDTGTPLQKGIADPAYGQPGGGVEVIFTSGTQPTTVTGPDKIPDK